MPPQLLYRRDRCAAEADAACRRIRPNSPRSGARGLAERARPVGDRVSATGAINRNPTNSRPSARINRNRQVPANHADARECCNYRAGGMRLGELRLCSVIRHLAFGLGEGGTMTQPVGPWEISLPGDEFEKLRLDPRLARLLTLARVVNALRFCQLSVFSLTDADTPSNRRQRINAFLFTAGILYEGLRVAATLGKDFANRKAFTEGMGVLLGEERTKELRKTILNRLRNKIVFHYDEDVAPTGLEKMRLDSYRFATGVGRRNGDVYYDLADEVAVNFILGEPESPDEERKILAAMITDVTEVSLAFADAAEHLIVDVLSEMGWRAEERPNGG